MENIKISLCGENNSSLWIDGLSLVHDMLKSLEDSSFHKELRKLRHLCDPNYRDEMRPLPDEYITFKASREGELGYMAHLFRQVQIHILDEGSKVRSQKDYNNPEQGIIIDPLGAYYPSKNNNSPRIEIYLSKIRDVTSDKKHYVWLFAKVMLHELAHALLDINNYDQWKTVVNKIPYYTTFGMWREESMANAIALKIIKQYGTEPFYEYAKEFVLSQGDGYSLGALLENSANASWVIKDKVKGVDPGLQKKWLDYVTGNPDVKGLEEWNILLHHYVVYELNGDYYTFAPKLITKVIKSVIEEYYVKYGRKISLTELKQLFPDMLGQCIISKDDDIYKYNEKLDLLDGVFYLCQRDWWDNSVNEYLKHYLKQSGSTLIKYTKE
ncbi:MAG: hypothetical protein J6B15_01585 [Muribaculaceae bacterium]|nr:hypothetical protein [Muribaculaceae bacterium]